jgi:hypothetical protein
VLVSVLDQSRGTDCVNVAGQYCERAWRAGKDILDYHCVYAWICRYVSLQALYINQLYMLGVDQFKGVLVLSAKFSDIFGRKTCLLTAVIIFVIFSAACGAAQTMNQL